MTDLDVERDVEQQDLGRGHADIAFGICGETVGARGDGVGAREIHDDRISRERHAPQAPVGGVAPRAGNPVPR